VIPTAAIAAVLIGLTLGGVAYLAGRTDGAAGCERSRAEERANMANEHARMLAEAQSRGQALARKLAAAESKRRTIYKETTHAIPAATLGRPCLDGDALGLLDTFAATRLPAPAGRTAGAAGAVATDTQIAGWVVDVIEQHERERARCNALIDWHGETK